MYRVPYLVLPAVLVQPGGVAGRSGGRFQLALAGDRADLLCHWPPTNVICDMLLEKKVYNVANRPGQSERLNHGFVGREVSRLCTSAILTLRALMVKIGYPNRLVGQWDW